MSALEDTGTAMALERGAFLERLDTLLRSDTRILAAWVGGSIGRGESDAFSDIDNHLAIADDHCEELNVQRRAFIAQFGEPLLVQEAPQNAPPGGAFQLVLYRGTTAPIEVDWSWRPASAAAILERAVVLFDRSAGGLPRAPSSVTLSGADRARQISLSTTFFWAMAFITAKKIARGQATAAFGLLRMMHTAQNGVRDHMMHTAHNGVRDHLLGKPPPTWGSIGAPHETLPPTDIPAQTVYLAELLADMMQLQPTTDGEGGLVTAEAAAEVTRFAHYVSACAEPPRGAAA